MPVVDAIARWGITLLLIPASAQELAKSESVRLTVVDDAGAPVAGAVVTIESSGVPPTCVTTDYEGNATFTPRTHAPYHVHTEKDGYFQSNVDESDSSQREIRQTLPQLQRFVQQVDVTAAPDGIDPQEVSDKETMDLPDIVNVPYPTSRDIRQLLQYFPGVVQDSSGQNHVAGSDAWAVLDTLDGFDIRSPFNGSLPMRFSADAIRSIDKMGTRYPVEYGRNTGGVIAFSTGMGDDRFRFNVTDFLPQFEQSNGVRFDHFVPRVTFSGPIRRNRAWFFDSVETEFEKSYVQKQSSNNQTNLTTRGSNLFRVQWNASPQTVVTSGLLFNDLHSPYSGLSIYTPRQSTTRHNTIAWLPYTRMQQKIGEWLLDVGFGMVRFTDGYSPYAGSPYTLGPESSRGAYYEKLDNSSQSVQSNATIYSPPHRWLGLHDLKAGVDVDEIRYSEWVKRSPVEYRREDRTLLRLSTFSAPSMFTRHNLATGAYLQDHWTAGSRWLFEPGLRFDWNEITRRPTWSPRISMAVMPGHTNGATKIAAGIGLYYEHTQLEYLARALAGSRDDTYYADDGITPVGPPLRTSFTYNQHTLQQPYAINWSAGLEQRLPGEVYLKANFIHKRVLHALTYTNMDGPDPLAGTYQLTNARQDRDMEFEIEAGHKFHGDHSVFAAYTHSSSRTNSVIDYLPTVSTLGPQQSGPLPWDSPDHVVSWGWLPLLVPGLRKSWDFAYTLNWRTGFPYTAINANHQVVGPANDRRFPNYLTFNPGVEWKFHFRGSYLGLRTVVENATNAPNPIYVNNNVDSPFFGRFNTPPGRTFSARIRLIEARGKR